jgi:hypothetical protein
VNYRVFPPSLLGVACNVAHPLPNPGREYRISKPGQEGRPVGDDTNHQQLGADGKWVAVAVVGAKYQNSICLP